ncbi:MAG: GC-type dockerin domain-anchored protein, partial [Phycisphaerales bacterium]|nr:GC-type dockerin domain-anchored protein [Phycisphaerales bacterium]
GDDPGFTDDPINAVLYEREDSSIENLESCLVGDDPGSNVIVDGGSVTLTDDLDHQFTQVAFQMCGSIVGPVNRIRFNCESIDSDCSGVLSTHVNGRWQSQHCEQYWEGESRTIDVYLDHMTSGEVPISFGFILSCEEDGAHSTIRVSDIRTGLAEARSACAADMTSLDSEYPQPDGVVDIADLLAALDHWGACDQDCSLAGCSGDVDFDCDVDGSDLLNLLDAWGPCY